MKKIEETNKWDAKKYNTHADFVSRLALPVVELLNPQVGERILDLGCGDGTLALEIEKYGSSVVAVDLSEEMVSKSRERELDARVMSATDLSFRDEFDAVFSNAMLHWVREPSVAIENIYRSLRGGGRFVAEFGGHGNVSNIIEGMREVFEKNKYGKFDDFWFFPTTIEYKALLESFGFRVEYIELIERPTPIDDISNWLDVFTNGITEGLSGEQIEIFRDETREALKETNYSIDDGWVADYVRLRVKAYKVI